MADASRDKALAGRIRAGGTDSYDLAGYSPAAAAELVEAAFGAPIEAGEMMKVTLVVGGGKKVRTAYGGTDGLVRDVCAALEKLGFVDDRGASCSLDCQGSFKYQHDTDKARPPGATRSAAPGFPPALARAATPLRRAIWPRGAPGRAMRSSCAGCGGVTAYAAPSWRVRRISSLSTSFRVSTPAPPPPPPPPRLPSLAPAPRPRRQRRSA